MFRTDRENKFKRQTIDELLEIFDIERSLSHKGCLYDDAMADATFKILKIEFVWNEIFADLKLRLWDSQYPFFEGYSSVNGVLAGTRAIDSGASCPPYKRAARTLETKAFKPSYPSFPYVKGTKPCCFVMPAYAERIPAADFYI